MLALAVIVLLLALILLLRVGLDAAFIEGEVTVSVKIGPFCLKLFPIRQKAKTKKQKPDKNGSEATEKKKTGAKPTKEDIREITDLGLETLGRLRRKLSIDLFMLHLSVASDDPCDTVINYGRINAVISSALPLLHRAFKVKNEDIRTQLDFETEKIYAEARLIAGFHIWEILYIVLCAGIGFLSWKRRCKKRRGEACAAERKG